MPQNVDTAPKGFIPKSDAAKRCGVTPRTICRWVEKNPNGLIRAVHVGPVGDHRLYVHWGDVRSYAKARRPQAPLPV